MHIFDIIAVLILFSGIFLFINTYFLKLPSSIGLSILAIVLSLLVLIFGWIFPEYHLAEQVKAFDMEDVLVRFVLSVMLFAGALNIDFGKLGDQLIPVIILAFFGVLISTFVIGSILYFMLDLMKIELNYLGCLVFGALISSTDPVAITKIIHRHRLSEELENKISGEALLNGGIAIVLALVLVSLSREQAELGSLSIGSSIWVFLRDLGGGLLIGLFFGWVGYKVLDFIDNDEYFKRKATLTDENGELFSDNDERAIFFAKGVIETVKKLNWAPDVIHVHGWLASLLPLYLKE